MKSQQNRNWLVTKPNLSSHLNGCSEHPADEGEDDAIDRHGDSVDDFVAETVGRPRSVAGNGLHG